MNNEKPNLLTALQLESAARFAIGEYADADQKRWGLTAQQMQHLSPEMRATAIRLWDRRKMLKLKLAALDAAPRGVRAGDQYYLSPWWVEVVAFTPKTRFVRFRKLTRDNSAPIERLSLARFVREGRAG